MHMQLHPVPHRGAYRPSSGLRRADIPHERLRRLHDLWHAKKGRRGLPARADIDVLELKPWLGHLILAEVREGDGDYDFRYRVYGTVLAGWFGRDLTGRTSGELPVGLRERSEQGYRSACRRAQPELVCQSCHLNEDSSCLAKLILPLGSAAPQSPIRVGHLLIAAYFV